MGKKAPKSARKFAAKGHLKKTIEQRHKHQQIQKKFQRRRSKTGQSGPASDRTASEEVHEKEKPKTVDDFLGAGFMDVDESDPETNLEEDDSESDEQEDSEDDAEDDAASFGSIDDLEEDEADAHFHELSKLAETDPEFYKYLRENDKELLEFDPTNIGDDDMDMDDELSGPSRPMLTIEILKRWQKSLLEARSLRALKKLLIAFRSAVHMNEEDQEVAWRIDNAAVYTKVLVTSFRYTPVVLEHHLPYKTLANGKVKPPAQTPKFKTLQKLILSYFANAIHIVENTTDQEMLKTALSETSKMLPYVMTSRRTLKVYLKTCLALWSSAEDSVRMSAFLSIRKLASSLDSASLDNAMKQCYLTMIKCFKSVNAFTMPSITFMKNTASEIYTLDHAAAYQHAFSYIRQLAIHLRNSMKVKTKDSYKQVYNWQFMHSIDFWSLVLARAAGQASGGKETELKPLIYPLIQVSLGSIRLVNNSTCHPFHLHVVRSLLHLTSHTNTYVPVATLLLPIITTLLVPPSKPKPSTLKPLDLELQLRAPQQYIKTRVYHETLLEESCYLLADWLASKHVHSSIAFPELCIPLIATLRKTLKIARSPSAHSNSKEVNLVKVLLERIQESVQWAESLRKNVSFTPGNLRDVESWAENVQSKVEKEAPLAKYVKVLRKTREKQRALLDKARRGEGEIVEDE